MRACIHETRENNTDGDDGGAGRSVSQTIKKATLARDPSEAQSATLETCQREGRAFAILNKEE